MVPPAGGILSRWWSTGGQSVPEIGAATVTWAGQEKTT